MVLDRAVVFDLEARLALKEGVDIVANVVKVTMGPAGRNVVYKPSLGGPTVTNDGVTVARDVKMENTFIHTGGAIVYEACRQTNTVAGDGTTTAAVLTQAMNDVAFKSIVAGANPMIIRRGMDPAIVQAEAALHELAVQVDSKQGIAWIAGMSAHDQAVGDLIADVFERQGAEGAVTVDDGKGMAVEVHYVDGMQIAQGLLSMHFADEDDTRREAALEDCDVLVTDRKLESITEFLPFLERYVESGRKRLFIVGQTVGGDVLTTIIANQQRNKLKAICIKGPVFGQRQRWMLEDLAIFTGATLVGRETGQPWRDVPLDVLGTADRVRSTSQQTYVIGGHGDGDAIAERVEYIWMQHGRAKNHFDREKFQERANNLSGSLAEILVGAPTEVERFELRHRIEDAISATRAGLEEGVVPGGGTALARASLAIDIPDDLPADEAAGRRVVRDALRVPAEVIANNAGHDGPVIVDEILQRSGHVGFNALSGKYEDLIASGVVDPLKVTRSALRNAASAAIMLITSEAVVGDHLSYHRWRDYYRPLLARKHGFIASD
jgi:chaperonin GroEL